MTNPEAQVAAQISQAYALAESQRFDAAAQAFLLARRLSATLCDQRQLDRIEANLVQGFSRERQEYRELIAGQRTGERTLLVLGDSLGLPRPDDKSGPLKGAERTYSVYAMEHLSEHGVDSVCQRFSTTDSVVQQLVDEPELGVGADVVLHVGLNDCANRMFLERERLSLDLLEPETKTRVVEFAQKYRRQILVHLPGCHYVTPERFTSNLSAIGAILRARGARRIVFATIILPLVRFWPATPGIHANFGNYNQRIMRAAQEQGALLFDIDRLIWAEQTQGVLLPDGMHLSDAGHRLFAKELAALLA